MIKKIIQFINQHQILSLTWFILLIAIIILTVNNLFNIIKKITSTEAIQLINQEKAIIIDVRSYNDFNKGHIINSINLTPSEIKDKNITKLEKNKEKTIILVSETGIEASKTAKQLVQYGFKRVFILQEGIIGWSNKHLPLIISKK